MVLNDQIEAVAGFVFPQLDAVGLDASVREAVVTALVDHKIEFWHPFVGMVILLGMMQLLYAIYLPAAKAAIAKGEKPATPFWHKPFSVVHNTLMCLFSLGSFLVIAYRILPRVGTYDLIYDPDCKALMDDRVIQAVCTAFYLSKYYEYLDVWLLICKGREAPFLQVFHHIGAAMSMGWLVLYKTEATFLFVILNGFIHTIMYYYYLLTTLGIRPWWKIYITKLQLVQFCFGLPLTFPYFTIPSCSTESKAALAFNDAYVAYLVVLFYQFYQATYKKKGDGKSKKKQ